MDNIFSLFFFKYLIPLLILSLFLIILLELDKKFSNCTFASVTLFSKVSFNLFSSSINLPQSSSNFFFIFLHSSSYFFVKFSYSILYAFVNFSYLSLYICVNSLLILSYNSFMELISFSIFSFKDIIFSKLLLNSFIYDSYSIFSFFNCSSSLISKTLCPL